MQRFLRDADNDTFVTHCYRFFFSREPDPAGKAHHLQALASGTSRDQLIQALVLSDEYAERFNAQNLTTTNDKFVPDGHFYSPFPASEEYASASSYAAGVLPTLDGRAANEMGQLALARTFKTFYDELPFPHEASETYRYFLNNGAFNYFDGIILYCFIRHLQPRRIIEVGSGFSSAAMMDTCETFLQGETQLTFIEPYPETLYNRMRPVDRTSYTVLEHKVQDVPLDLFRTLRKNDILFIDSSHVAKFGSDVNHLLFNVLPLLDDGVVVHVHDIFRHFDYPIEWLREGRAWNEAYVLRAFLESNPDYSILFFNDWFAHQHWDYLEEHLPLCTIQPKGSPFKNCGVSLWLQKTVANKTLR